jgi:hypothetical protein
MATCYNRNAPEYVELSENFGGNVLRVNDIIGNWQKANNSEEFPTVVQANEFIKVSKAAFNIKRKEFGESLLANLSRNKTINKKSDNEYYITRTESVAYNEASRIPSLGVQNKKVEELYRFLEINGLSKDTVEIVPHKGKLKVTVKNNLFTASDIVEPSRLRVTPRSKSLLQHLVRIFPSTNVVVLTPAEAERAYNSLPAEARPKGRNGNTVPFDQVNSLFYDNTAVLIQGRTSNETAIEEILHPFIDAVHEQNNELFMNLLDEAKKTFPQLNQQIQNSYTTARGFNETDRALELVTQALSRHFNNEYETKPTKSFLDKVKEFLEWFSSIVTNLHEYVTGKPLIIRASGLNAKTTKLTDIAKLINTKDIVFDTSLKNTVKPKVKFNLSPLVQEVVDYAINQSTTDVQREIIKKLTHASVKSEKEVFMLAGGLADIDTDSPVVVLNEKDHTYMDINSGEVYKSTTQRIKGTMTPEKQKLVQLNLEIGNEFDSILDGIVLNKTFEEIKDNLKLLNQEQAKEAYDTIDKIIRDLTDKGGVPLTQVVLFDKATKTAGTADLVIIGTNGEMQIVDLKTSKNPVLNNPLYDNEFPLEEDADLAKLTGVKGLSTRQQHNLQVNIYRRMLENMGYKVSMEQFGASTVHIHVDITGKELDQKFLGTFRYDTLTDHPPSQNKTYVDYLVPANTDPIGQSNIEETLENLNDNPIDHENQLTVEEALAGVDLEKGDPGIQMVLGVLDSYKGALLDKAKAIKNVRSQVFMSKSETATLDNIAQAIAAISLDTTMGRKSINRLYTEFLQDALKDVRKFRTYVEDPKNFGKSEYISYVLNYDRFIETYRNLYEVEKLEELNATQRTLVLNLQIEANKVVGTKSTEGLIDQAIDNYVKEVVRTNSNRNFTEEQIDDLLKFAEDISGVEYQTGDLATSKDTLLALMDKIYKRKKQELLDKLKTRDSEIRFAASRLQKLSPNVDPQKLYDFMIEFDEDGKPSGRYVKKLGPQYYNEMMKRREALLDETGNWKRYINITNIDEADPSDIKYNKELFQAKKAYAEFWRAEEVGPGGKARSGDFHDYSQQFKDIRAKYEYFVPAGNAGYWVKKSSVPDRDYRVYRAKYYQEIDYTKAVIGQNGLPTGQIIEGRTIDVPKNEYRVAKAQSRSKGSMISAKYDKLNNPTTELERAQRDFYNMFIRLYEEGMLAKLPQAQRTAMLGKMPVIKGKLYEEFKDKPNIVTKMWADTTRSVKNLFTETGTTKVVLTDEKGNLIDSMPIFYTGKLRNEEELANIENKIQALHEKRKDNKIGIDKYKTDLKFLRGEKLKIQNAPAAEELNLDMGAALLKFNAMAEHYETMNEVEDTLKAMVNVIERREYEETADTRTYKNVRTKMKDVGIGKHRIGKPGTESNVLRRAKKWMNMVYYDNDKVTRNTMDKLADGLIQFSSLSYVAFNPFGNFNNYALGRINNSIEALGQRFFALSSYARAEVEFNKRALPDLVKRLAYNSEDMIDLATFNAMKLSNKKAYDPYKAGSKYEALVDLFRMMDDKSDIREAGNQADKVFKSWFAKATEVGYVMQDAAEYNVQTKIGMAILMDTMIRKSSDGKNGEQLSLYDAFRFNSDTKEVELLPGYDTIIEKGGKEKPFTDEYRFDLRNKIREVNKQIHGNYAYEDRMVMQASSVGRLAAQFHKWVAPAIKARFRREYFDENLGWMEGRYRSMFKLGRYVMEQVAKGEFNTRKWMSTFKEQYDMESPQEEAEARAENVILNTYRTLGELGIMLMTLGLTYMLEGLFKDDDDDSDFEKRFENFLMYQADRTYKEMVLFMPVFPDSWTQLHQMFKSPIASTRTLGELGEALSLTVRTPLGYITSSEGEFYGDSDYVYQKRPKKGQLKVSKAWKDALPIIYSMQKWENYIQDRDFFIK